MSGLIERLEAASEGSQEFDAEIACIKGWYYLGPITRGDRSIYRWSTPTGDFEPDCPWFTASLDAAVTLVPEGLPFEVTRTSVGHPDEAFVWNGLDLGEGDHGTGATPALALCIAALKARGTS